MQPRVVAVEVLRLGQQAVVDAARPGDDEPAAHEHRLDFAQRGFHGHREHTTGGSRACLTG